MNLCFKFSWIGLIIFAIPMLINILYMILPPKNNDINADNTEKNSIIDLIESISRIVYAVVICIFASKNTLNFYSPFLLLAIIFLLLYYIVWIRYFLAGRNVELMTAKFLGVPMPLAIFPVLYFLFASLWVNNLIAFGLMIVFGITHNYGAYKKLTKTNN